MFRPALGLTCSTVFTLVKPGDGLFAVKQNDIVYATIGDGSRSLMTRVHPANEVNSLFNYVLFQRNSEVLLHVKSDVLDDAGVFLAFMGAAVWESCRHVYQPTQICFLSQSSASRLSGKNQEWEFQRLDSPRLILQLPTLTVVIKPLKQFKQICWKKIYIFHPEAWTFQFTHNGHMCVFAVRASWVVWQCPSVHCRGALEPGTDPPLI